MGGGSHHPKKKSKDLSQKTGKKISILGVLIRIVGEEENLMLSKRK